MAVRDIVCLLEADPAIERLMAMILEQDCIEAKICPFRAELPCATCTPNRVLALVDVGVPLKAALAEIRRVRAEVPTPVLATSAHTDSSIARACIEGGAGDYLLKPFDPDVLLDRTAFLLGRPPPAEQEGAVFGGGSMRLNLLKRTLTVQGNPVPISRTEWDILRTLALNAGEPVFHRDLARAAFDPELRGDAEYLKLWVTRLQTKIGQDPANQRLLRPFHDVAYVLAVDALPGE